MAVRFALLAGAALVSAPLAADTGQESPPSPQPPAFGALACEGTETLVFAGDVQDDFGLSIAVCVGDQNLTIHYSGEGDPQAVSCRIGECAGIIDFKHYVRYRLTIITLAWRDENGEFKLTESLDAQNEGEAPVHIVTHSWSPEPRDSAAVEPLKYPVAAYTEPLSLLRLSDRI